MMNMVRTKSLVLLLYCHLVHVVHGMFLQIDETPGKKHMVLACAARPTDVKTRQPPYSPDTWKRFIVPLRETGYTGDIVILAHPAQKTPEILEISETYNVRIVDFVANRTTLYRDRFIEYQKACNKDYQYCWGFDFRDVYFQGDPFDTSFLPKEAFDILLVEEAQSIKIEEEPFNKLNMGRCYKKDWDLVKKEPVINCGSVLATPRGMSILSGLYGQELEKCGPPGEKVGLDQSLLNALHRNGGFKKAGLKVLTQIQGKGAVNTVATLRQNTTDDDPARLSRYLNADLAVINEDGRLSPAVHQFDRHKMVEDRFNRLFKELDLKHHKTA